MNNEVTATKVLAQSTYWRERVCAYTAASSALLSKISDLLFAGALDYRVGDVTEKGQRRIDALQTSAEHFLKMADEELAKVRPWSWKRSMGEPQAWAEEEESRE